MQVGSDLDIYQTMKPKRLAATEQILQFYLSGLSRLQIVVVLHFVTIRNF